MASNFNESDSGLAADFNFDGKINALDFNALAANFGAHLLPPAASPIESIAAATTASLFSRNAIGAGAVDDAISSVLM